MSDRRQMCAIGEYCCPSRLLVTAGEGHDRSIDSHPCFEPVTNRKAADNNTFDKKSANGWQRGPSHLIWPKLQQSLRLPRYVSGPGKRLSRESLDLDIGQLALMSVGHHHTQATRIVREVHGISLSLMLDDCCSDSFSNRAPELLGPFTSSVLKILRLGDHPFLRGICPDLTGVAPGYCEIPRVRPCNRLASA
jgi:hypothetical protein